MAGRSVRSHSIHGNRIVVETHLPVNAVAESRDRPLDNELIVYLILPNTKDETRGCAIYIVSKLDDEYGKAIRARALDSSSLCVSLQSQNTDIAEDFASLNFTFELAWGAFVRFVARPWSCLSIECFQGLSNTETRAFAFVFSGYPHEDEALQFERLVMPHQGTGSLPNEYGWFLERYQRHL